MEIDSIKYMIVYICQYNYYLRRNTYDHIVYEVYWDYIDGLKEDFWKILEYFGRDFVEPKRKGLGTVGYSQALPWPMQPLELAPQNEAPALTLKTFW